MTPQLCLGTAQFGLAYGITNVSGQVSEAEVKQLLAEADNAGIAWLDTAQAYGEAEAVLGRQLSVNHRFRLITKLPAQASQTFTKQDIALWDQAFRSSCDRLGSNQIDALLLHSPADLRKPGSEFLQEWLIGLKQRGLVRRLGLSIYGPDELVGVDPLLLDLVQLPLSLLDQRLLEDATVASLRARGTAIHARSLYLQGLLLTSAAQWPSWVGADALAHQRDLEALAAERGCQLVDLALGFAKAQFDLEAVVIGLCSMRELHQLSKAWLRPSPWRADEWRSWGLRDSAILDPRCWPRG